MESLDEKRDRLNDEFVKKTFSPLSHEDEIFALGLGFQEGWEAAVAEIQANNAKLCEALVKFFQHFNLDTDQECIAIYGKNKEQLFHEFLDEARAALGTEGKDGT